MLFLLVLLVNGDNKVLITPQIEYSSVFLVAPNQPIPSKVIVYSFTDEWKYYLDNIEDKLIKTSLTKLANCESGNIPSQKVLDVNDKYSYGLLQFQVETAWREGIYYGLLDDTTPLTEEAMKKYLFDPLWQIKLGEKMISDNKHRHWLNCFNKIFGKLE